MLNMKMNRYWIENIEYSLDPYFLKTNEKINLSPKIGRQIEDIDSNRALVKIVFELKKKQIIHLALILLFAVNSNAQIGATHQMESIS